jgi:hypothetical protein
MLAILKGQLYVYIYILQNSSKPTVEHVIIGLGLSLSKLETQSKCSIKIIIILIASIGTWTEHAPFQ